MCGRYVSPEQASIERFWNVRRGGGREVFAAHFNAAPTQLLPVIRVHPESGRELALLRWGLIPSWAKNASIGSKMINARGETVAEKPSFRSAFNGAAASCQWQASTNGARWKAGRCRTSSIC